MSIRPRRHRRDPVFYAFDLLWLDGEDMRGLPLIEGKRRLRRLIRAGPDGRLHYADHIERRGVESFRSVCERDCEGIVARRKQRTSDLVQNP